MSDWRAELAVHIAQICRGEGMSYFVKEDVLLVLSKLTTRDKRKPKALRSKFSHLETYSEAGMTRLLNLVQNHWNNVEESKMTLQSVPTDSVHRLQAVITAKLDKDNYDPHTLMPVFKDYLIQHIASPFDCLVVRVAKVFGPWYDLELRYSCNLIEAYKLITLIPWVSDALVRPVEDFGKRTLAIPE